MAFLSACAPQQQPFESAVHSARLGADHVTAPDGASLPLKRWLPRQKPKAVIVALHGMNDYSNAFSIPAPYFTRRGIALYAYDQRGFGASPQPGIWPGTDNLRRDLSQVIEAVHARHPRVPLYVMGESMGGAVAVASLASQNVHWVKGLILVAPALWGGDQMPDVYRALLWMTAHTFPYSRYDGSDLKILASNNIPMLRSMLADPLVQKNARADAIFGLVRLMDGAYHDLGALQLPVLLLYGGKDEVIPPHTINEAIGRFSRPIHLAYYPDGYHMLLRDVQGEVVAQDIAGWIQNPRNPLPSGRGRPVDNENNALFSRD